MPKGKTKGKRCRSDDIPPEPSPEIRHQNKCLFELQEHLLCQTHSGIDMQTYCWVEVAGKGTSGRHREVDHEEMTLWAKHIVSRNHFTRQIKTYQAVGSQENDKIPPTEHQKVQPPTYQEAEECACNA